MMQRVFWLIIAVSLIVSTVSTADDKDEESDLDIGSLLQMGKIFQNYQLHRQVQQVKITGCASL